MTTVETADVVAERTRIAQETLREVEDPLRSTDDAGERFDRGAAATGAER